MMLQTQKNPEEISAEASQGKVSGYGGYSARHEYEKGRKKKRPLFAALQIAVLALLLVFSCLGIIALIRGDFVPKVDESDSGGTIKVPTQSELAETARPLKEIVSQVELSLITVEVQGADGTLRHGTGFFVSEDGYAVCSSYLVSGGGDVTAYTSDGISVSAELKGIDETIGVALLRLPQEYQYTPIPVENSFFVERGKTLNAVSAHKPKVFYGTVAQGVVGSVGPAVQVGKDGIYSNIIYLDIDMNKTLQGAVVVDESGAAVGFLTVALPTLHGNLVPVVPINIVYTVINDLLVQG